MKNSHKNNVNEIPNGIMNEVIVCFGYSEWKKCKSDQEIMILLSKKNKIFYVEVQESFVKKGWITQIKSLFHATQKQHGSNYWVLTVPRLPYLVIPYFPRFINGLNFLLLNYINKRLLGFIVKRYIERLDLIPTMVWLFNPYELPVIKSFNKQLVIYRIYDEVSLFPLNKPIKTAIEHIENKYIKKVDLIFASSKKQYKNRNKIHPHTYFIPQAVNFNLSHSVLINNFAIPRDLINIKQPIIGFIGGIDFRIDFTILRYIAKQHPNWSVILIGQIKKTLERNVLESIEGFSNIYFLGEKKKKDLPPYLKFINISIIPYYVNESTRTMYLTKLHEHLAAGLPIVSSSLPELMPFKDLVRIAGSKEQFLKYVEEELQTDCEENIKKRVEVARKNTWENRIDEMAAIIASYREQNDICKNASTKQLLVH